jgi:hypothetical protein
MRFITHDWPDKHAKNILKQLRAAAQSYTKLIVYEFLVSYAAPSNEKYAHIPGAELPLPPYPLLPNLGPVSNATMLADLQVSQVFSSNHHI